MTETIEHRRVEQARHHQAEHLAHAGMEDVEGRAVAHLLAAQPRNLDNQLQEGAEHDAERGTVDAEVCRRRCPSDCRR